MTAPTPNPGRRRPPPRLVEVVAVDRLTPRLVSITVTGEALRGFELTQPTSHIKVFLAPDGGELVLPTHGPDGPVFQSDACW